MNHRIKIIAWGFLIIFLLNSCSLYPVKWDYKARNGVGIKGGIETQDGIILSVRSEHSKDGGKAVCFKSFNGGKSWTGKTIFAYDKDPRVDIGDSSIIQLKNGNILCAYRDNHLRNNSYKDNSSAIRVVESIDNGKTWRYHSTIADCIETTCGVWASFLFQKKDGTLQCYYDDEITPFREGFDGHQWVTMKSWDENLKQWVNPVTVSRAHNPEHLSRDGMPSVVEFSDGKLLCVLESVKTDPPHKGIIRSVVSLDGGATWSWREREREVVYETKDVLYNALAPWMIETSKGFLICAFITDEDRAKPDTPSTSILIEDVKAVYSFDGGKTWSKKPQTISKKYPCVLPGVLEVKTGVDKSYLLVQYVERGKMVTKRGKFVSFKKEKE